MDEEIEYRHWQPGDDDDILPLVLSTGWVDENYYRHKFDIYPQLEPEGIRLAITEGQGENERQLLNSCCQIIISHLTRINSQRLIEIYLPVSLAKK